MVFLHLLYSDDELFTAAEIQNALGASSGSVSQAFKLFVRLSLLDCLIDSKTKRQKRYFIKDKAHFYRNGIQHFGSPVHRKVVAPKSMVQSEWLKCGLSALADIGAMPEPYKPEYALSYEQWTEFLARIAGDDETARDVPGVRAAGGEIISKARIATSCSNVIAGVENEGEASKEPGSNAETESSVRSLSTSARNKMIAKRALAKIEAAVAESEDEPCVIKELWYDPSLFARDGHIDPVTLLATIDEDAKTEAVEHSLTQILSSYNWYLG